MKNTASQTIAGERGAAATALERVAWVLAFAVATALAARLAIPLPNTPVPITAQSLVVLLCGVTLGPGLAAASMALYLALGATGYHVFALGDWGFYTVAGARGGYLIGFLLAAPLVGLLTRGRPNWSGLLGALLAGKLAIFAAGVAWLALALQVDLRQALLLGFWPFVPGLVLKVALALGIGRLALRARPHFR
jgi:biotin transport system substrate-specific component